MVVSPRAAVTAALPGPSSLPKAPDLGFRPRGLYLGGAWVPSASGQVFETINPSTGECLGEVPLAGEADVDRAVRAARAAFAEWSRVPVAERARALEGWSSTW